jgi:hypothetical protein
MTHHYVCYINVAIDNNKKCKIHQCCCGLALTVGMLVYCDARYITLVKGRICYMDVRAVTFDGKLSCHVGVVKVLPMQLKLVANRFAKITEIHRETTEKNRTYGMARYGKGYAKMVFFDVNPQEQVDGETLVQSEGFGACPQWKDEKDISSILTKEKYEANVKRAAKKKSLTAPTKNVKDSTKAPTKNVKDSTKAPTKNVKDSTKAPTKNVKDNVKDSTTDDDEAAQTKSKAPTKNVNDSKKTSDEDEEQSDEDEEPSDEDDSDSSEEKGNSSKRHRSGYSRSYMRAVKQAEDKEKASLKRRRIDSSSSDDDLPLMHLKKSKPLRK